MKNIYTLLFALMMCLTASAQTGTPQDTVCSNQYARQFVYNFYNNTIAPADSAKQDKLVSGTNIKTINGISILGSGDLVVSGGSSLPSTTSILKGNGSGGAVAATSGTDYLTTADNAATSTSLQTGRTIGMTGDVTYTSPSFNGTSNVTSSSTLATVNSNVGSFGSASTTPAFTVNGKGLTTAAANVAIQIAQSQVTNLTTDLAAKQASLISGTNIKTINGSTLLGSGDISISGGGAATDLATSVSPVNINASSPPSTGQVLTATSSTSATWQTPSGGGSSSWTVSGQNQYNSLTGNVGIGNTNPLAPIHVNNNTLASGTNTDESGLLLENTTAAASANQKPSPAITFKGQGWKTTATAASQSVEFTNWLLPVQGSSAPTASLLWQFGVNGGAAATRLTLTSAGLLTPSGGLQTTTMQGSGNFTLTNGTHSITSNSTTANSVSIVNNGLTSGTLLDVASSGGSVSLANKKGLNVILAGNVTGGGTTYGASITNFHANASGVSVGLSVSAANSPTNYAIISQLGQIGFGTTTPLPSALLDVTSTTQGFLLPRMSTTERLAISSPASGLQVYDNSLNVICVYNGAAWTSIGTITNATTTGISSATLNSAYPNAPLGVRIVCGNIALGGAIYTKYSSTVWLMTSAPVQM